MRLPPGFADKLPPFAVITGETASGKSRLAIQLAQELCGEVISCDSVQVYKGFDIGSAKLPKSERCGVAHHLLDCVCFDDEFDAALYAEAARKKIIEITCRGHFPIVVGGTGLYLRALLGHVWNNDLPSSAELRSELAQRPTPDLFSQLAQLDRDRAQQLHPNDRIRILRAVELCLLLEKPISKVFARDKRFKASEAYMIALKPMRQAVLQAITQRTLKMLQTGLIDEVRHLLSTGCTSEHKPMRSIGYRQVCDFLAGETKSEDLAEKIMVATRQYGKRQRTWFRAIVHNEELTEATTKGCRDLSQRVLEWHAHESEIRGYKP